MKLKIGENLDIIDWAAGNFVVDMMKAGARGWYDNYNYSPYEGTTNRENEYLPYQPAKSGIWTNIISSGGESVFAENYYLIFHGSAPDASGFSFLGNFPVRPVEGLSGVLELDISQVTTNSQGNFPSLILARKNESFVFGDGEDDNTKFYMVPKSMASAYIEWRDKNPGHSGYGWNEENWDEFRKFVPLFHPEFLDQFSYASHMRFLGASQANSDPNHINDAGEIAFDGTENTVTKLSYGTWRGYGQQVPAIFMAEICNQLKCDFWYNHRAQVAIPFLRGDTSHIEAHTNRVKKYLDPSLKYIDEYCNEIWNYAYPFNLSTSYVRDLQDNNPDLGLCPFNTRGAQNYWSAMIINYAKIRKELSILQKSIMPEMLAVVGFQVVNSYGLPRYFKNTDTQFYPEETFSHDETGKQLIDIVAGTHYLQAVSANAEKSRGIHSKDQEAYKEVLKLINETGNPSDPSVISLLDSMHRLYSSELKDYHSKNVESLPDGVLYGTYEGSCHSDIYGMRWGVDPDNDLVWTAIRSYLDSKEWTETLLDHYSWFESNPKTWRITNFQAMCSDQPVEKFQGQPGKGSNKPWSTWWGWKTRTAGELGTVASLLIDADDVDDASDTNDIDIPSWILDLFHSEKDLSRLLEKQVVYIGNTIGLYISTEDKKSDSVKLIWSKINAYKR